MSAGERLPFFLEVGVEDLPARFVGRALADLREALEKALAEARIACSAPVVLGTPRRLVLHFSEMDASQARVTETKMGPPEKAAFDAAGKPTKAGAGFAERFGLSAADLKIVETSKGPYVAVEVVEGGRETRAVLADLLPAVIAALSFPKSMKWGSEDLRFGRPIRWIVALQGTQVVPFEIADVRSGSKSRGHRILAPAEFEVRDFHHYREYLFSDGCVVVDPKRRRQIIEMELEDLAQQAGGRVVPDAKLMDEVVDLVEAPRVVMGGFEEKFLALPRAVLIAVMRGHQRYFALEDGDGRLVAKFLTATNMPTEDTRRIVRGNERVIRARLADAEFFYQEDLRRTLDEMAEGLMGVVFQAQLGTSWEKKERVAALARALGERFGLSTPEREHLARAAGIAKADLMSRMVGEFPELQGTMGRWYAEKAGEPAEVAAAIEEHYQPRGAEDALPPSSVGAALSIADRLDTLVGFFGVGKIPTGAADPFALRRHALATLNILLAREWDASLSALADLAAAGYPAERLKGEWRGALGEFLQTRLRGVLQGEGVDPDVAEAVLSLHGDRPAAARRRARALQAMKERADFADLAVSFKRVANITKGREAGPVEPGRFQDPAEHALFEECARLRVSAREKAQRADYEGFLEEARALKAPVDRFFDAVLVMAEDERLRENRLNLLYQVGALFAEVGDFGKIQTPG